MFLVPKGRVEVLAGDAGPMGEAERSKLLEKGVTGDLQVAGHMVPMEQPALVNERIAGFLTQLAAG